MKAECWFKEKTVNLAEEQEVSNLFLTQYEAHQGEECVWLVDNGCFNHMTGMRELFQELNEYFKMKVRLGDNKEIQVMGRGTVAILPKQGNLELLHNVQFAPNLAHNLLSVGQILDSGYSNLFDKELCYIKDRESSG